MSDILEATTIKVRAKVSAGVANPADFEFKFFKDGTEVKSQAAAAPSGTTEDPAPTEPGWVEAKFTVPNVDDTAEKYTLKYKVVWKTDTKEDFTPFTVWPKAGSLKVVNVKKETEGLPGFKFKLVQGGKQQGDIRTVTNEDGTYNFDLQPGHAFSIDPVPPSKIPDAGWTTATGRNRACKGDFDITAAFLAPESGAIKQYVNFIKDVTTASVGQDGLGPVVRIQVGVKGDSERAQKLGKAGTIVNVRATFGPKTGNGGIEKSTRTDDKFKTEIKDELDLSGTTGPDADKVYKGKITLKKDGTGEMKVYLGLAGGDTCKIEIAGSDRFLTEATVAPDATITFTNWRKVDYELMAPDFYAERELVERVVDKTSLKRVIDFPKAGLDKLKETGDALFIEYTCTAFHSFKKENAPGGATELSKKFLEIDDTLTRAYVLTDFNVQEDPKNFGGWVDTQPDITNHIKLCDANYYWETTTARKHVVVDTNKRKLTINVPGGYFIPTSGFGEGSGAFSVKVSDKGAEGFKWTANVDLDSCKTVVDTIVEHRPKVAAQSQRDVRMVTITETYTKEKTQIQFFKPPSKKDVATAVSPAQKTAIEKWLTDRFNPKTLRGAKGNKVGIKISGETGPPGSDTRFNAVKTVVETKLTALEGSNSISVHPGLSADGTPQTGTLTGDAVNMTESNRTKIVLDLPHPASSLVGDQSSTKCPITIECYIEAHSEALGLCKGRTVLACFQKATAAKDLCVTMHELGHSYGQAVFTTTDKPPKGMTTPKKVTEAETVDRYKDTGSNGHAYDSKGHSGSHCAYGLSDSLKGEADYQVLTTTGAAAKCIMYGQGGRDRVFCPQCVDLIRGANLTKIPPVAGS